MASTGEAVTAPLRLIAGYLPIEDHGLIGDGSTAALVGRDGAVSWLCVPRFDSPPLFCRLLDAARGGTFTVAPEELVESRQFYEPDTVVLVTELRARTGLVCVTDALALRPGTDLIEDVPAARGELIRQVHVLDGHVGLRVEVEPLGDAEATQEGDGLRLHCRARPDLRLALWCSRPLAGFRTRLPLKGGDRGKPGSRVLGNPDRRRSSIRRFP
jgi:alpha,alpha-trehalase